MRAARLGRARPAARERRRRRRSGSASRDRRTQRATSGRGSRSCGGRRRTARATSGRTTRRRPRGARCTSSTSTSSSARAATSSSRAGGGRACSTRSSAARRRACSPVDRGWYAEQVDAVAKFLEGRHDELSRELADRMKQRRARHALRARGGLPRPAPRDREGARGAAGRHDRRHRPRRARLLPRGRARRDRAALRARGQARRRGHLLDQAGRDPRRGDRRGVPRAALRRLAHGRRRRTPTRAATTRRGRAGPRRDHPAARARGRRRHRGVAVGARGAQGRAALSEARPPRRPARDGQRQRAPLVRREAAPRRRRAGAPARSAGAAAPARSCRVASSAATSRTSAAATRWAPSSRCSTGSSTRSTTARSTCAATPCAIRPGRSTTTTARCTRCSRAGSGGRIVAPQDAGAEASVASSARAGRREDAAAARSAARAAKGTGSCPTSSSSTAAAGSSRSRSRRRTTSGCTSWRSSRWRRSARTLCSRHLPGAEPHGREARRPRLPARAEEPHPPPEHARRRSSSSRACATRPTASRTARGCASARSGASHSPLDDVKGLGGKTKKALLTHVGNLAAIRAADDATLLAVPGITAATCGRCGPRSPHRTERAPSPGRFAVYRRPDAMAPAKKTILVVDDEPHIVLGLRDALEFEGFRVIAAGRRARRDRARAERGAGRHHPRPDAPGHERLRGLRGASPHRRPGPDRDADGALAGDGQDPRPRRRRGRLRDQALRRERAHRPHARDLSPRGARGRVGARDARRSARRR